jgi:hypothetical protein
MAMSAKDHPETPGERAGSGDGRAQADPSRRAVLRGAAGAGVAGVAASALIGLPASQALASTARSTARPEPGKPSAEQAADAARPARDVVVHLRDARSGEMDIFSGTSQTRLRDPDLASRLVRAIR